MKLKIVLKGGEGSGNFSHAGRPGLVGGSAEGSGGGASSGFARAGAGKIKLSSVPLDKIENYMYTHFGYSTVDDIKATFTAKDEFDTPIYGIEFTDHNNKRKGVVVADMSSSTAGPRFDFIGSFREHPEPGKELPESAKAFLAKFTDVNFED